MDILYVLIAVVVVGFCAFFILLPRYGPHYTSLLVCPRCKKHFYFHWVPGASLNALRYGNKRPLKCPYCHEKSMFEIASTRISKAQRAAKT
jgi:DNA-directed RNA polymerase subunit RPC12/RpoP